MYQCINLRAAWPATVLGFVAGCWLVQMQPDLPAPQTTGVWLAVAGLVFALVMLWVAKQYAVQIARAQTLAVLVCVTLAGSALGISWAAYDGAKRVADGWPAALEGRDITATGYVATMPVLGADSQRVLFVIERADHAADNRTKFTDEPTIADDSLRGKTLSLSQYGGGLALKPAQRYRVVFRAKQRHGSINPDGFDYERWLVSRGIAATGYFRIAPVDLGSQVIAVLPWVERARSHIRSQLFANAPHVHAARWAAALALGDQRSLGDADWQRYNATGTGHLLAVSGTHIMLIGAMLAWLAGRWWQGSARRLLRLPVQTLRVNVMLGSSAAYALLAGWALPAQRTVLMLAVAWWALRYMAKPALWHIMACAAFIALWWDPMAAISPSFWLSYGAVAVLIGLELRARDAVVVGSNNADDSTDHGSIAGVSAQPTSRWDGLRRAARNQVLLSVALIPLGAVFFNQISLVSPLANALAIPVMGWVSTPLALLAAAFSLVWGGFSGLLMQTLMGVQWGMDMALDGLLRLPYAQLFVPSTPWWWAVFGAGSALASVGLQGRWRWAGVGGVLVYVVGAFSGAVTGAFAWSATVQQTQSAWRVVFLDVGQGAGVVVHSQGRTLLFDTGPRYSADSDGAARIIVPYLHAVGVRQLDHVIVSHADDDHSGGARSLLARLPVTQWWASLPREHPLTAALPASTLPCAAGQPWVWAGLTLQMLHPDADVRHGDLKPNAVSCVLRITDGTTSVLLAADIEAAQEAALVTTYGAALQSTVLLSPHHGSKTSSTPAFLNAVQPTHVVIQNGYRNRFNHPHPSVSQRYTEQGLTQWRSDHHGAVIMDISPTGLQTQAWRQTARRYWHTAVGR